MKHVNRTGRTSIITLVSLLSLLAVLLVPLMVVLPVAAAWGAEVDLVRVKSIYPEIDAIGNYVMVVWADYRDSNVGEIYCKRSADWGAAWGPDVRLTNNPFESSVPDIEISGATVHVVYTDNRTGAMQIYYRRSGDLGNTWGAEVRLSSGPGDANAPRVNSSGGNVYVVWDNTTGPGISNAIFTRSVDDGLNWGPLQVINRVADTAHSPDIAASGNIVGVTWTDDRGGLAQIYYQQSLDFGQTWAATDTALTSGAVGFNGATAAITGSAITAVCMKDVPGGGELWYRRSSDSGLTWGALTRFDGGPSKASNPTIAVLGSGLHVAWLDWRDGSGQQIYYKYSFDAGQTWGADTRLTTGALPFAGYPTIGVSSHNVHVSWSDQRNFPADPNIYYMGFTGSASTANTNASMGAVNFAASDGVFNGLTVLPPGALPCAVAGYFFPYGMFSYSITWLAPGETVQVTLAFPYVIPSTAKYFKCRNGTAVDCSAFMTRVNDKTIRLTLTDGGIGDADGLANGTISDPGGIAFLLNTTPSHQSSIPSAPQAPVSLSNISVKSAALSAVKAAPGTPVTVTASVINTGIGNGSSIVKVYVNGAEESSQGVTVNGGGAAQVSFDITRNEPGTYSVYVGGTEAGSFTVDQFTPDTILIISGALVFFSFVLGLIYIAGRKQRGY
jgi:hypothetical protein